MGFLKKVAPFITEGLGGLLKPVQKITQSKLGLALLGVGLIAFTGPMGAALLPGLAGAAGAASAGGGLFASGTFMHAVASKAATWAAYGAVSGGVSALITGDDPLKGAFTGAIFGGIGGGVAGGLGHAAQAAGLAGSAASGATSGAAGAAAKGVGAKGFTAVSRIGAAKMGGAAAGTIVSGAAPAAGGVFAQGGIGHTLLNSPVVGGLAQGAGEGLMGYMAARDAEKAEKRRAERIAQSYDIDWETMGAEPDELAAMEEEEDEMRRAQAAGEGIPPPQRMERQAPRPDAPTAGLGLYRRG